MNHCVLQQHALYASNYFAMCFCAIIEFIMDCVYFMSSFTWTKASVVNKRYTTFKVV